MSTPMPASLALDGLSALVAALPLAHCCSWDSLEAEPELGILVQVVY